MLCLPQDVLVDNILNHLYPDELIACRKLCKYFLYIINSEEKYIDSTDLHSD